MIGRWRSWHFVLLSLLSLPLFVAGECEDNPASTDGGNGGGSGLEIPSSWANTYRIETTDMTTLGNIPDIAIDVLCAGDDAVIELFPDGFEDADCEGTIDDSGGDITCTYQEVLTPGCTQTTVGDFTAERNTSTGAISGSISVTTSLDGTCFRAGDGGPVETIFFNATVIDGDSPGCASGFEDVVHEDWGGEWTITLMEISCDDGTPTGKELEFSRVFCPGYPAVTLLELPKGDARPAWLHGLGSPLSTSPSGAGRAPEIGDPEIEVWGGFSSTAVNAFFSERRTDNTCPQAQTWYFQFQRTGDAVIGTVEAIEYTFSDGGKICNEEVAVETCIAVSATRTSMDTSACTSIP